jgi:hypothetical protein
MGGGGFFLIGGEASKMSARAGRRLGDDLVAALY